MAWVERTYRRCFGRQHLLADSIEIFIPREKKVKRLGARKPVARLAARNLQDTKTLLAPELSQYSKSGSMFSSSKPVAALSDCCRLGNALCLCSPVRPGDLRQPCRSAAPRAWPLILPSKPSIVFWNSLRRDCQMTGRGSNLDSNLDSNLNSAA